MNPNCQCPNHICPNKGYSTALRTGPNIKEYDQVNKSNEHFYGHPDIEYCGKPGLCLVEHKEDLIYT